MKIIIPFLVLLLALCQIYNKKIFNLKVKILRAITLIAVRKYWGIVS